ncbi:MAG: EamA family transporter [Armatimonadetes bacterium]|nr:EamA family transporter [Armatimonadota bacterium]
MPPWRTAVLCGVALCSFAANSLLCRLALRSGSIDPTSFTAIRLASGAIVLGILVSFRRQNPWKRESWLSGVLLFLYAICFSLAYLGLSAGTGALVLFGSVQTTMIGYGILRKQHPEAKEWIGLLLGSAGVVYLVLPGVMAPPLFSALLMAAAGAAWGLYSIRGKANKDPVASTAANFLWSMPLGAVLMVLAGNAHHASSAGVLYAIVSGAITSGLGYVVWYAALKHLSSNQAAILQLSVPVLAAIGGVTFLQETMTWRLVLCSALVFSGVLVTLRGSGVPRAR